MRDIRVQFFLTLGALGTVMPSVSVFFQQAKLSDAQVGYAYSIWSLAALFSPVLLTMLADSRGDSRWLLAISSVVTAACLVLLTQVRGVPAVMGIWTVYCVASTPIFPLQDGIHFALQRRARETGKRLLSYHLVRAWGTVGFAATSLISFFLLQRGLSLHSVLVTGAAFSVLAAVHAMFLRNPRAARVESAAQVNWAAGLPSIQAVRAMLHPQLLVFCIAVVLVQMTAAVHAAFYAIYLVNRVHLEVKWLGPVSNVGVGPEVALVFACGWIMRAIGVKRLLLLGMLAMGLRLALIAVSVNPWIAVGSQVLHGLFILATGVVPHTILDRHAGDRYRHSMQGMLVMIISGGQALAAYYAGRIAAWSLSGLFGYSAVVCVLGATLIALFFREPGAKPTDAVAEDLPVTLPPLEIV